MNTALTVVTIAAYLIFMIAIGFKFGKTNKSVEDFYLGGRKLGPFVTAMSAEASDMSSWLLMGLPGVALIVGGFAEAFWTAAGLAIGTYLNWLIVAKRIRRYTEETKSATLPDFFANRYADKSGALVAIAAVIIIVFFVPYTASGFAAVGKLFNSLFGADYHVAMIIGAIVVVLYTVIGGFLAVSTTDFIQSIVMTIALFTIICFGVSNAGGVAPIVDNIRGFDGYFSLTSKGGLYVASTLAWGLGYFGMPHVLLRFMAIDDEKKLKTSRRFASVWVVFSMAMAIIIGIIGYTFAKNAGILAAEGFDSERIIIYMSDAIKNLGPIFAIIAGLILAGILAATMSTADSQLLAASSSVSENIIHRFFKKDMTVKESIWFSRITVCIIAVVSVLFAWNPDSSVFRVVSFAWAGFGGAFGPIMLFSLFWRRTNKYGAFAGILSGGVMVFVWKFCIARLGGLWEIYELLPAFVISCVFIVAVSLLTAPPESDVTDTFDKVKAMK